DGLLLAGSSADLAGDRRLVSYGWDLEDLARRYRRFVAAFAPVESALRARAALPAGTAFVVRTLLIHEYRKIHLQDPLLPPARQPPVSATSIRFTVSTPLVLSYVPSAAIARTAVMPVRSPASAATKSAKEVNESTLWLPPGATCAIANVIGPVVLGTKLSPVDTVAGSSCSGPIRITCACALSSVDCVMRTWVALNGASNGAVTPGDAHASRAKALVVKKSTGMAAEKSGGAEPKGRTNPRNGIGDPAVREGTGSVAGTLT